MENSCFKLGHIVRYGKKVGTVVASENGEEVYFRPIIGEDCKINYAKLQGVSLSDEQFKNMGFEIVESKIETKSPNLKMFTILKLNTGRISDFEKYDSFFPSIGEGVISYEEGKEVKYLFHSRLEGKFHRIIPIKTINELQDALEAYKTKLDFDSTVLIKIEGSMNN